MNTKLNQNQIWRELAREVKWSASALAKKCGVSLRTLERYFLKEKRKSPKAWLLEQRHDQVNKLMRDGLRVKELAGSLDYKHPNHLTNGYKKKCGYCPTDKSAPLQAQNP